MRQIILVVTLFMGLGIMSNLLADEVNPQIANCQEITDPDTQLQAELCTAHVGCKLVMGIHKACTKVKTFLNNLKNLSFGKKEIDSSDVFDAAAPNTVGNEKFESIAGSIKKKYSKSTKKQVTSGEFDDGTTWVYEGPIVKGERNGTGVLLTEGGTMFRGEFVKGKQKGKGEIISDGAIKAGDMLGAKMNGDGVEINANGTWYEGGFKDNQYDGKGKLTTAQGNSLEGNFTDGKANGKGTYRWKDGGIYEGDFVNGNFEGHGRLKTASGDLYDGEWKADKKNGKGTYIWKNGAKYEGEWHDGKKLNGIEISATGKKIEFANGELVKTPQQHAAEIGAGFDQKINAAKEECQSSKDSCETKCAGLALLTVIAKNPDVNENQRCMNECADDNNGCLRKVSDLESEKQQAVNQALAPKPAPAQPVNNSVGNSSNVRPVAANGKSSGFSSGRICDTQCGMIVAESKCKNVRGNEANLSCQMQNGIMLKDTPELCAQAQAVSGCVMKKDYVRPVREFTPSVHDNVCERNLEKIDIIMYNNNINHAGATYDLFIKDINWGTAKLFEPCIRSSEGAASIYKRAMDEYNKINAYCSRPHEQYECNQWGAYGGVSDNGGNPYNNIQYYKNWKAEIDKALSNPNYSAELGPVRGPGGDDPADIKCFNSMKSIQREFERAKQKIPSDSVVVLSEATMWMIAQSVDKVNKQCPKSRRYVDESRSLQKTYQDTKRTCDAMASNPPCKPRLPGKAPVPVPQVSGKPLPPLKDAPEEQCGKPPSPNAIKCLEKKCAKQDGEITVDKKGCAHCNTTHIGIYWFVCPDGMGGVR